MEKIDLKRVRRDLYAPSARDFALIDVPSMMFVKVDGEGDPNRAPAYRAAVEWLFSVSYAMKFASKTALEKDYVVMPLEGLWGADDPESFTARRKDDWSWTMMVRTPDFVGRELYEGAVQKASSKLGGPPVSLRLEPYAEGLSLQILHNGSYDDEGPTLARLHQEVMPGGGYVFNGPHHEIYLSDARRTDAAKLRTILRQPVSRIAVT